MRETREVGRSLTDYRYKLFSARALQSNSAALWLYERMCASLPTSAAEGCGDRVVWKGSWSFIGSMAAHAGALNITI